MTFNLLSAPLLIAVFAIFLGTGIDALIKWIAPDAGLHHLLAWRFLFGAMIALAVFKAQKRPKPDMEAVQFHSLRGAVQVAAAFLFFYAVLVLPLALATIIGFTAALMVPFVARALLNEEFTKLGLGAAVIGFSGAVLSVLGLPESDGESGNRLLGLIACFAAAFLYALTLVLLRMRATKEDATTIAMFTNVIPAILLLPITFGLFGTPDWSDIPIFAFFGLLGFSVWYLMTLAYARAPAQQLAPLEYTALIWS
ncbi:MAG: DMT family transporter, partial [Pseudomonadota bacterium]